MDNLIALIIGLMFIVFGTLTPAVGRRGLQTETERQMSDAVYEKTRKSIGTLYVIGGTVIVLGTLLFFTEYWSSLLYAIVISAMVLIGWGIIEYASGKNEAS